MFNTIEIAGRIKDARIRRNMTQMQLADEMGVSFQAVSNWERGNSMPDISKLEDLCRALDLTVNELLGVEERTAETVSKAMQKEEPLTAEELADIAPVLPPQTVKKQVEAMREALNCGLGEMSIRLEETFGDRESQQPREESGAKSGGTRKKKKLNLSAIADLAPFLDREYLDELIADADLESLAGLDDIAPFLSRESLDALADRATPKSIGAIVDAAPFMSKEALDKLVRKCEEISTGHLEDLAPFLSKETLDALVDRQIQSGNVSALSDLAPFLSGETLKKIAKKLIEDGDLDSMENFVPFL